MVVLFHVLVALSGVACSSYAAFRPSVTKLNISYTLVALTIFSGTYLVLTTHAALLQACMAGLLYVGVCLVGIVSGRQRLARADTWVKKD